MAKLKEGMQIALFGGSFSPPHLGHLEICRYLLEKQKMNEVWLIPCFIHPFGKPLASFEDRIAMCNFLSQEFGSKVLTLDVEKKLGGISYTVKTIEYLKKIYPGPRFTFVVGGDWARGTEEWKDHDKIKSLVPIITIPRGPNSPIPNISSTDIRMRVMTGESIRDLVTTEVAVYIITHGLFTEEESVE